VDVGARFTTVVFGRGENISFVKLIPIGGESFNKQIAAKLGISISEAQMLRAKLRTDRGIRSASARRTLGNESVSQDAADDTQAGPENQTALDASTRQTIVDAINSVAEQLAREISLCFRYYTVTFRGKRVERAIFSGGEAYETILLNVLRRQLAVEIQVAQPLKGFNMEHVNFAGCRREMHCEWAVAVGLSLKGWKGDAKDDQESLSLAGAVGGVDSDERN
jgi:type IV pilus assembly protein PilM